MISIAPAMLYCEALPYERYESVSKSKDASEMLDTIAQKGKEEFLKRTYPNTTKFYPNDNYLNSITIKNVRFSPPATIVFWSDNTKTVVKAQNGEPFDAEKGLMACIIKRITGNTGRYNELFKKYIKEDK